MTTTDYDLWRQRAMAKEERLRRRLAAAECPVEAQDVREALAFLRANMPVPDYERPKRQVRWC